MVLKAYQPVTVFKNTEKKSLFLVVMTLLCFDYDKCWCCLDCFGLFLCTEWILFSGVKLLISRCVFFLPDSGSPAFYSTAVAWDSLGAEFKFITVLQYTVEIKALYIY